MKLLSIIIPVFNERQTITQVISTVRAATAFDLKKEIILIEDGSTDGTKEIVAKLKKKWPQEIQLISHTKNRGKGSAVREGILASKGDIVLIQDADLEYSPDDYEKLIRPIILGKADVVCGSRFKGGEEQRIFFYSHYLMNKMLTIFSNFCSNLRLTDVACGYKAFEGDLIRDLAQHLESKRFGFDVEVVARLAKRKVRAYEVGVMYFGRTKAEGKKISWVDGLIAVMEIIKYNFLR